MFYALAICKAIVKLGVIGVVAKSIHFRSFHQAREYIVCFGAEQVSVGVVKQVREVAGYEVPLAIDHFAHVAIEDCIKFGNCHNCIYLLILIFTYIIINNTPKTFFFNPSRASILEKSALFADFYD
jgi:hypothetical protein